MAPTALGGPLPDPSGQNHSLLEGREWHPERYDDLERRCGERSVSISATAHASASGPR